MVTENFGQAFEEILMRAFELQGYRVASPHDTLRNRPTQEMPYPDIEAIKNQTRIFIEAKFFRSQNVTSSLLKGAANQLAYFIKKSAKQSGDYVDGGIIAINSKVSERLSSEIRDEFGVFVWDRNYVYNLLNGISEELREQFEQLLLQAQQGLEQFETIRAEDDLSIFNLLKEQVRSVEPRYNEAPSRNGALLVDQLSAIECGRQNWHLYEEKCAEILNFLFRDDLASWFRQRRTDDDLSRFDLICRIASKDAFWATLVSAFRSRFVLFEFKNYCDSIGQNEVYLTERYLFEKGLRSVGFIVTRSECGESARNAAKGALREHGKLILILSDDDLIDMLRMKDRNQSPSDHLANILDDWLIKLSR